MGAFVNFNAGQQARRGAYMTILRDEKRALEGCAERIESPESHGRGGLAHRRHPHARRSYSGRATQSLCSAAAPVNARHARLEELKQQLPARVGGCHGDSRARAKNVSAVRS